MKYRKIKTVCAVIITIIIIGGSGFGIYKGILYAKEVNKIEVKDDKKVVNNTKNSFGEKNENKEAKTNQTSQNTQTTTSSSTSNTSSTTINQSTNNTTTKSTTQSKTVEKKTASVVGTYDLVELTDGNDYYNKEQLDSLRSAGYNIYLEMRDNNTGVMNIFSEIMEFTYDEKYISDGEDNLPYTFSDNKIIFEADGAKMIFQKK